MALFPLTPIPSDVSAPEILDPTLRFESDSGYEVRRSLHSRPRRRYAVAYLGKTTDEMHAIRDFLQLHRLGTLAFEWLHPTAQDLVTVYDSVTPVVVQYFHGLMTGQWIHVQGGPAHLTGVWQVTKVDGERLALNGSLAGGPTSTAYVRVYLPYAVARFSQDTWESPAKLIGPEQGSSRGFAPPGRTGMWNFHCTVEEIF